VAAKAPESATYANEEKVRESRELVARALAHPVARARACKPPTSSSCAAPTSIRTKHLQGPKDSLDYRVFFKASGGATVSPWHDIPLYAGGDGLLNFVCEIPKETSAKMECATDEPNTPIKQDTKKGKLRFYPYNINWK
jgi:inorganic pyrophosphatase